MTLTPVPPIATGTVTTAGTASPIEGAAVTVSGYDAEFGESVVAGTATTAADGTYEVYDEYGLGAGQYQIVFEADDHYSDNDALTWTGTAAVTVNMALEHVPPIASGTIVDSVTQLAIEGASVSAAWLDASSGQYLWAGDVFTDASGRYSVYDAQGRGPGTYQFTAVADGYRTQTASGTWTGSAALSRDFRLVRIVPVAQGTVSGPGGTTPIEGAKVEAARWSGSAWLWEGDAYTDAQGAYTLWDEMDLGAGTYQFTFSAASSVTQVLTRAWAGNSTLTVSVSLVPKSPLATGRVTDAASQNPIEGVWVVASWQDPGTAEWFWDGFDYTDSNGDYAVYDTDARGAGAYRFYVEADGWLPVTTAPQAWDGSSTLVRNFMLELPPPVAAGTITSASGGAVIEGAAVETSWYDAVAGEYVFAGEAFSDAAGHYEVFDDIGYGAGTYELLVQKAGFAPVTRGSLEWGGTSALAQDVALSPLGALAIGSVSGPGGAPVEGATVEAWRNAGAGEWVLAGEATSGAEGTYSVYNEMALGVGQYEFRATAPGYHAQLLLRDWSGPPLQGVNFTLAVNRAPQWQPAPQGATVTAQTLLTFTVHATDADGDTPSYHMYDAPEGATLDGLTGVFSWTPTAEQGPADYTFQFVAADGMDESQPATVTITVDEAPVNSTIPLEHDAAGLVFDRWVTGYSTAYSGGGYVYGRWTGTILKATFTGSSIKWIGPKQPSYGMADVWVDGVKVATDVDCYAPDAQKTLSATIWESGTLSDGQHTIELRPMGRKNAASPSFYVVLDRFEVTGSAPRGLGTRHDDLTAAPGYSGTWLHYTNPTYFNKTYAYSRWAGARFDVAFTGTRVAWIGPRTPNYGIADVYIDNVRVATVDTYRANLATQGWREVVWQSAVLPAGPHTISIRPTGAKNAAATAANVVVDAVDVAP